MSKRSDVSKMLVSHHSGRTGSSVGSAVGPRRLQRGAIATDGANSIGVSDSAKSGGSQSARRSTSASVNQTSSTISPASTLITTPTSTIPKNYGFLQMKCLDVLKKSSRPLHIQEVQVILGSEYPVVGDRDFLRILSSNPRVQFDIVTKLWTFVSPYKFLIGPDSILTYLRTHRQFDISNEVLEYNKDVAAWITDLLSRHVVRAIRGTKTSRCKVFSSESGLYCNLYKPNERCEGCKGLQGVVLYPLGSDYLETVDIDPDVKELWHKIAPTPLASVSVLMGSNKRPATDSDQQQGRVKRKKPAGARAPRVHKIANVHMYTAEELKEVLAAQLPLQPFDHS